MASLPNISLFKRNIIYIVFDWNWIQACASTCGALTDKLRAGHLMNWDSGPSWGKRLFCSPSIQISCGVHPTSCSVGNGVPLLEIETRCHEAHQSHLSSAKVMNGWRCTSIAQYACMAFTRIMLPLPLPNAIYCSILGPCCFISMVPSVSIPFLNIHFFFNAWNALESATLFFVLKVFLTFLVLWVTKHP